MNTEIKKGLLLSSTALAALAVMAACNSSDQASLVAPANNSSGNVSAVDSVTPQSGAVSFTKYTHEDGTPMSDDELKADIAMFPELGVNYQQLVDATHASLTADGTLTLSNSSGNVLVVVPQTGFQTIKSLDVTEGTQSAQSCTGTSLLFDLSAVSEPEPCQKDDDKCDKGEAKSAGFHVLLTMECSVIKQEEPKPEPTPTQSPSPTPTPTQSPKPLR